MKISWQDTLLRTQNKTKHYLQRGSLETAPCWALKLSLLLPEALRPDLLELIPQRNIFKVGFRLPLSPPRGPRTFSFLHKQSFRFLGPSLSLEDDLPPTSQRKQTHHTLEPPASLQPPQTLSPSLQPANKSEPLPPETTLPTHTRRPCLALTPPTSQGAAPSQAAPEGTWAAHKAAACLDARLRSWILERKWRP